MKTLFISAFLFLLSHSSFALPALSTDATLGKDLEPMPGRILSCVEAQPNAYMNLCSRFSTENGTIMCIEAGKGGRFYTCALDQCHRYRTENGSIQCLQAIKNKSYNLAEMNICSRFTTEEGLTGCLAKTGTPLDNSGDPDQYIITEIEDAVDLIDQAKVTRARKKLLDLLDYLYQQQ